MRLRRLLAVVFIAAAARAPAGSAVIATRGGDTLTIGEARAFIATLDADTRAKLAQDPAALTPLLRDMLLRRAFLAEAVRVHWAERPEVAALLVQARETVLLQSYLAAQTAPSAGYPTDADLQAAYAQNRQRLLLPRQYHLAQVSLGLAGTDAAAARARLLAVKQATASGLAAAAEAAALPYDDLGWMADSSLGLEVRQAVAGLPVGQIAGPICERSVCRLVLLVATKPAGPAEFAQARDTLVGALRQQKQQENLRALENALLAKAPVRVNELDYPQIMSP